MPWQNHRAAVSLTFDDGLPCQIQHALPVLNNHGLLATFFLIVNSPYDVEFRTEVWKKAAQHGHEIGSHGLNHKKASELNPISAHQEAAESKRFLSNRLGTPIDSFCYPFTDAPPIVQDAVKQCYHQARGGRVAARNKLILPNQRINLHNIPCIHVNDGTFADDLVYIYLDAALERGAWLTMMFHGVGPDPHQWDNVNPDNFIGLCKFLVDAQNRRGLWVAPFGTVAKELPC